MPLILHCVCNLLSLLSAELKNQHYFVFQLQQLESVAFFVCFAFSEAVDTGLLFCSAVRLYINCQWCCRGLKQVHGVHTVTGVKEMVYHSLYFLQL